MDTPLDNERHLRYWKRCLRTLLPHQYTSNDSIRMTLGCFIIASIDLLTPPDDPKPLLTTTDRRLLREWVLACQHPGGGFAGSPTHALPAHAHTGFDFDAGTEEPHLGVANVAATYFALQLLGLLAEEDTAEAAFDGVDRRGTLEWLRSLQREDGSFGEVVVEIPDGDEGTRTMIAGGRDMRYSYLAAVIRWVLRGDVQRGDPAWVEDINVHGLVKHMRAAQTYDGGYSEDSNHESHGMHTLRSATCNSPRKTTTLTSLPAGYTYCAISALSLLDRPPTPPLQPPALERGIPSRPALVAWLTSRPFAYVPPSSAEGGGNDEDEEDEDNFAQPAALSAAALPAADATAGYNGRCNKVADTCYAWWVAGALALVGAPADVLPRGASRAFLLEHTQHLIGGFAKHPGGPPDVYHGYLGLAALAVMGEPGLKEFDAALCISTATVRKLEKARGRLLEAARGETAENALLGMGLDMLGRRPQWLAVDS
jgi:geranylgeranyl transferase type-1 subunit beta